MHVVCRSDCRLAVMFTRHYMQTSAVEPVYRSGHRSSEGSGLAAVCEGRAHTDSVQPEFRCSRWSAHRWLDVLNADCAISNRWPTSASSLPSPCSLLPRYRKWGTFSSGGSLPMTTLSRDASAARLFLDLTALSVKEPTRDRCVRPPPVAPTRHVHFQAA